MITKLNWSALTEAERMAALSRSAGEKKDVTAYVNAIVQEVREGGNDAVARYASKFDGYTKDMAPVPAEQLKQAADNLTPALRAALEQAIANITAFHAAQKPASIKIETMAGVQCEMVWRPIEKVGLYVPAGTAPLFSAVLMLALPAKLAGCERRILCTPPRKDGTIDPSTLAAAYLCGITEVFPVGGPWSIAALAYGTQTIPKVDKIFGPGNGYVTAAKMIVAQDAMGAAIDMPAGPSEIMVIADGEANPAWVAADLLAQAEHAGDSQAILLSDSQALIDAVAIEIDKQMATLSRAAMIEESLKLCRLILVRDLGEAAQVANRYAPEHLILQGAPEAAWPTSLVASIQNAGSVFVGAFSPETAGDYASGTNHILPTYGLARAYGGLNLMSFMRSMTVQTLTREGLTALAPTLITMASAEGLDAHAGAVTVRINLEPNPCSFS